MPCSINFSVTLQTEILSTVTSDFLKQMIILKSFNSVLTLKAPITTAADDIHKYFFHCFSEKIRLDVSSESFARQRIHMKNQTLFSSKDTIKKLKCRLLQFLFGALRVNL